MSNLQQEATQARKKVLELIYRAGTSHIGSNLGVIDILAVLFDKLNLDEDKFILSAGWKAAALYYFLWRKGKITEEELNSYCQDGSKFIGLAEPIIPEISFAGGSMCLGLAAGVGFALAKKLKKELGTIYVLESDGGMNGGPTWEALAIASQHKLDNLVLIIDRNSLQAMGKTEDILKLDLKTQIKSFGWEVFEIDGHDYDQLEISTRYQSINRPLCIIANTIKGKGIPKWENENLWHYAQIKQEDYEYALSCLK